MGVTHGYVNQRDAKFFGHDHTRTGVTGLVRKLSKEEAVVSEVVRTLT